MIMSAELTRPTLLVRIRDLRDSQSWSEFVDLYTPLIRRFIRRANLQDADAEDVTQHVLADVSKLIGQFDYDRSKGRFRNWLFTVTRTAISRHFRHHAKCPPAAGDTSNQLRLSMQPALDLSEDQWNAAYRQRLFEWAAEKVQAEVQPHTWQAFWMSAVEGRVPTDVARQLGIRVGAVYVAKNRVIAKFQNRLKGVEDDFEPNAFLHRP